MKSFLGTCSPLLLSVLYAAAANELKEIYDLSGAIPTCDQWTGIAGVYDGYCQAVGCSSCSPLGGNRLAFRKCVLSQPLCKVPGWSAHYDPRCQAWSGLVATYTAWCREQECPKCVTSDNYEKCVEDIRLCNIDATPVVVPTGIPEVPSTTEITSTTEIATLTSLPFPATTHLEDTTTINRPVSTQTVQSTAFESQGISTSDVAVDTQKPQVTPNGSVKTELRRVAYLDINYGTVESAVRKLADAGFTHAMFAFWVYQHVSGTKDTYWDAAAAYADMSAESKQELQDYAHSKGLRLMLSVGGATESLPAIMALDGEKYGEMAAERAVRGGFDGVDFDLEGFAPSSFNDEGVQWLQSAFKAARRVLGEQGQISSAPQAPYFGGWGDYGYNKVEKGLPHNIVDFYFIQYYNQGGCSYDSEDTLMLSTPTSCWAGDSAVAEIVQSGVDGAKIVVGKYSGNAGSSGYVPALELRQWVCDSANQTPSAVGGWGVWEYATDSSFDEWLNAAKMGAC